MKELYALIDTKYSEAQEKIVFMVEKRSTSLCPTEDLGTKVLERKGT